MWPGYIPMILADDYTAPATAGVVDPQNAVLWDLAPRGVQWTALARATWELGARGATWTAAARASAWELAARSVQWIGRRG